jgi:hypothetical protein
MRPFPLSKLSIHRGAPLAPCIKFKSVAKAISGETAMPRSLNERVPYDAIVDRPPLKLPGDARLAVWLIVT